MYASSELFRQLYRQQERASGSKIGAAWAEHLDTWCGSGKAAACAIFGLSGLKYKLFPCQCTFF